MASSGSQQGMLKASLFSAHERLTIHQCALWQLGEDERRLRSLINETADIKLQAKTHLMNAASFQQKEIDGYETQQQEVENEDHQLRIDLDASTRSESLDAEARKEQMLEIWTKQESVIFEKDKLNCGLTSQRSVSSVVARQQSNLDHSLNENEQSSVLPVKLQKGILNSHTPPSSPGKNGTAPQVTQLSDDEEAALEQQQDSDEEDSGDGIPPALKSMQSSISVFVYRLLQARKRETALHSDIHQLQSTREAVTLQVGKLEHLVRGTSTHLNVESADILQDEETLPSLVRVPSLVKVPSLAAKQQPLNKQPLYLPSTQLSLADQVKELSRTRRILLKICVSVHRSGCFTELPTEPIEFLDTTDMKTSNVQSQLSNTHRLINEADMIVWLQDSRVVQSKVDAQVLVNLQYKVNIFDVFSFDPVEDLTVDSVPTIGSVDLRLFENGSSNIVQCTKEGKWEFVDGKDDLTKNLLENPFFYVQNRDNVYVMGDTHLQTTTVQPRSIHRCDSSNTNQDDVYNEYKELIYEDLPYSIHHRANTTCEQCGEPLYEPRAACHQPAVAVSSREDDKTTPQVMTIRGKEGKQLSVYQSALQGYTFVLRMRTPTVTPLSYMGQLTRVHRWKSVPSFCVFNSGYCMLNFYRSEAEAATNSVPYKQYWLGGVKSVLVIESSSTSGSNSAASSGNAENESIVVNPMDINHIINSSSSVALAGRVLPQTGVIAESASGEEQASFGGFQPSGNTFFTVILTEPQNGDTSMLLSASTERERNLWLDVLYAGGCPVRKIHEQLSADYTRVLETMVGVQALQSRRDLSVLQLMTEQRTEPELEILESISQGSYSKFLADDSSETEIPEHTQLLQSLPPSYRHDFDEDLHDADSSTSGGAKAVIALGLRSLVNGTARDVEETSTFRDRPKRRVLDSPVGVRNLFFLPTNTSVMIETSANYQTPSNAIVCSVNTVKPPVELPMTGICTDTCLCAFPSSCQAVKTSLFLSGQYPHVPSPLRAPLIIPPPSSSREVSLYQSFCLVQKFCRSMLTSVSAKNHNKATANQSSLPSIVDMQDVFMQYTTANNPPPVLNRTCTPEISSSDKLIFSPLLIPQSPSKYTIPRMVSNTENTSQLPAAEVFLSGPIARISVDNKLFLPLATSCFDLVEPVQYSKAMTSSESCGVCSNSELAIKYGRAHSHTCSGDHSTPLSNMFDTNYDDSEAIAQFIREYPLRNLFETTQPDRTSLPPFLHATTNPALEPLILTELKPFLEGETDNKEDTYIIDVSKRLPKLLLPPRASTLIASFRRYCCVRSSEFESESNVSDEEVDAFVMEEDDEDIKSLPRSGVACLLALSHRIVNITLSDFSKIAYQQELHCLSTLLEQHTVMLTEFVSRLDSGSLSPAEYTEHLSLLPCIMERLSLLQTRKQQVQDAPIWKQPSLPISSIFLAFVRYYNLTYSAAPLLTPLHKSLQADLKDSLAKMIPRKHQNSNRTRTPVDSVHVTKSNNDAKSIPSIDKTSGCKEIDSQAKSIMSPILTSPYSMYQYMAPLIGKLLTNAYSSHDPANLVDSLESNISVFSSLTVDTLLSPTPLRKQLVFPYPNPRYISAVRQASRVDLDSMAQFLAKSVSGQCIVEIVPLRVALHIAHKTQEARIHLSEPHKDTFSRLNAYASEQEQLQQGSNISASNLGNSTASTLPKPSHVYTIILRTFERMQAQFTHASSARLAQIQVAHRNHVLRARCNDFQTHATTSLGMNPLLSFNNFSKDLVRHSIEYGSVKRALETNHSVDGLSAMLGSVATEPEDNVLPSESDQFQNHPIISPYTPAVLRLCLLQHTLHNEDKLSAIGVIAKVQCNCVDSVGQIMRGLQQSTLDMTEKLHVQKHRSSNLLDRLPQILAKMKNTALLDRHTTPTKVVLSPLLSPLKLGTASTRKSRKTVDLSVPSFDLQDTDMHLPKIVTGALDLVTSLKPRIDDVSLLGGRSREVSMDLVSSSSSLHVKLSNTNLDVHVEEDLKDDVNASDHDHSDFIPMQLTTPITDSGSKIMPSTPKQFSLGGSNGLLSPLPAPTIQKPVKAVVLGADDLLVLVAVLLSRCSDSSKAIPDIISLTKKAAGEIQLLVNGDKNALNAQNRCESCGFQECLCGNTCGGASIWTQVTSVEETMTQEQKFLMVGYYVATLQAACELILTHK